MTALKMECVKMLALAYKRTISFYYYVPLLTSQYSTEVEKVERHVEEVESMPGNETYQLNFSLKMSFMNL